MLAWIANLKKKNESTWPCATFVSQSAWSDANTAWWHLSANAVMQMIYRRVTPLDYILYISLSLSRPSLPLCVFVCVRVRALSCDLIDWAQTMERPSEASRMNERYSTQVENHQPCVHLTKKNKNKTRFFYFTIMRLASFAVVFVYKKLFFSWAIRHRFLSFRWNLSLCMRRSLDSCQ